MKKDITTKDTIKTITEDIAKYILEKEISDIEFVDKELQRIEKREADIVALCKIDGIKSILHLEIQNSNDNIMPYRMLRYYTDIVMRYPNLPIYQYLIYIGKNRLSMSDKIVAENIDFCYNIIDMHTIDCEKFLSMDTPDALVLAILCDFKDKEPQKVISYIIARLRELTKDDEYKLGKYMLILEELSSNRNLESVIEEVEKMLRDMRIEELPGYRLALERGIERGIQRGIKKGIEQGKKVGVIKSAITMIEKFKLPIDSVAKELNIPKEEIEEALKNEK